MIKKLEKKESFLLKKTYKVGETKDGPVYQEFEAKVHFINGQFSAVGSMEIVGSSRQRLDFIYDAIDMIREIENPTDKVADF